MNAMGDVAAEAPQARSTSLKFEIGARTLVAIQRYLVRIPLTLDEARAERLPVLPPLPREAHGYGVTSLPEQLVPALV
uniref:hypothetical protein n=1 Tax=Escherichia coli TaxID=562 RepID=UPI0019546175